jgi:hypothetical protein
MILEIVGSTRNQTVVCRESPRSQASRLPVSTTCFADTEVMSVGIVVSTSVDSGHPGPNSEQPLCKTFLAHL